MGADANRRRWPARLVGAAVGMSAYASFALLAFAEEPDPGCILFCPSRSELFLMLVVGGTPVLAVAAGLLALFRRTRPFAAGLAIGVVVSLLGVGVWLLGR